MAERAPELPSAGLTRRLAAIVYDAFLLVAVYMITTALALVVTGGETIAGGLRHGFQVMLMTMGLGFFALFWRYGGQTLGMRAWRLQVRGRDGALSWREAWLRSVAALISWLALGLGFAWSLIDREGLAWHDRLSRTRLIVIPKARR